MFAYLIETVVHGDFLVISAEAISLDRALLRAQDALTVQDCYGRGWELNDGSGVVTVTVETVDNLASIPYATLVLA